MTPEGEVLKSCLDYLPHVRGSVWFRRNVVAGSRHGSFVRSGPNGHLDIWGIWYGVHCEIEVKRPGWVFGQGDAKRTKRELDQMNWIEDVKEFGGIAFWVDSLDSLLRQIEASRIERGW